MNFALQAMSLIQMIDRNGGPPAKHRAKFERVRQMVQQDAYGGDLGDLGILPIPLFLPYLVWLAKWGAGAVAVGAAGTIVAGGWEAKGTVTDAMRTVIWGGAAWALYQLYKRR